MEEDRKTGRRKVLPNRCGTPQGGVVSPLLANLYLNDLDHAVNEQCEQKPTMVRYADDLLILAKPGQGAGLQSRLKRWLEARKLKLNEEKPGWSIRGKKASSSSASSSHGDKG